MTEQELEQIKKLQNILSIFVKNGDHFAVTNDSNTVIFNINTENLPYKDELIIAGAYFDTFRNCWIWKDKE